MTAHHHILERLEHDAPFWRLVEAFRRPGRPGPWLLDSALDGGRLGRFSYLGPGGGGRFEARRRSDGRADVRIVAAGRERRYDGVEPFAALGAWRDRWRMTAGALANRPAPFVHGAVGWIGYEAGHCIERYPDTGLDDLGLPDIRFGVQDTVLIRDHDCGVSWLSVLGRGRDGTRAREAAERSTADIRARLAGWTPGPDPADGLSDPADGNPPVPAGREAAYLAAIRSIQHDIREGRVFECCLTQRFEQTLAADPWRLYAVLRRDNPAPFAGFLDHGDATILSASPERFLSLDDRGRLETRPIKGTRPRHDDPLEDTRLRDELAASAKDRAENVMIVDLARNDLGRVCETGSVHVPGLCEMEKYATVWQLVSTVRGRLRAGLDGIDALRACFPGGSMTGAPKIEAMRMIDELETHARGPYAGAIGWLDSSGAMDLNIVIRTIVVRDGRAVYGGGGAVTADSDPDAEWRESLDKVRALARAIAKVDGDGVDDNHINGNLP